MNEIDEELEKINNKVTKEELEKWDTDYENSKMIKPNKVAFLEYFSYLDSGRLRKDLLNRIEARQSYRRGSL